MTVNQDAQKSQKLMFSMTQNTPQNIAHALRDKCEDNKTRQKAVPVPKGKNNFIESIVFKDLEIAETS